jgi:hypothetical protein
LNVSSFIHNKCLCGSPLPSCKWSLECYCFSEIGVTICYRFALFAEFNL